MSRRNPVTQESRPHLYECGAMLLLDLCYLLETGFSGVDILMTTTLKWALDYNQKIPINFMEYLDHMGNRPGYIAALEANKMP